MLNLIKLSLKLRNIWAKIRMDCLRELWFHKNDTVITVLFALVNFKVPKNYEHILVKTNHKIQHNFFIILYCFVFPLCDHNQRIIINFCWALLTQMYIKKPNNNEKEKKKREEAVEDNFQKPFNMHLVWAASALLISSADLSLSAGTLQLDSHAHMHECLTLWGLRWAFC